MFFFAHLQKRIDSDKPHHFPHLAYPMDRARGRLICMRLHAGNLIGQKTMMSCALLSILGFHL